MCSLANYFVTMIKKYKRRSLKPKNSLHNRRNKEGVLVLINKTFSKILVLTFCSVPENLSLEVFPKKWLKCEPVKTKKLGNWYKRSVTEWDSN